MRSSQLHCFSSSSDSSNSRSLWSSALTLLGFLLVQADIYISQQASGPGRVWMCQVMSNAAVSLLVWRLVVWGGSGAVCRLVSASSAPLQQQHGHHPQPSLRHALPPHEVQLWSHQRECSRGPRIKSQCKALVVEKCALLQLTSALCEGNSWTCRWIAAFFWISI